MITFALTNENINWQFPHLKRRISREKLKLRDIEVSLELGREKSLLADYVYALRSKVDRVNRYKVARQ